MKCEPSRRCRGRPAGVVLPSQNLSLFGVRHRDDSAKSARHWCGLLLTTLLLVANPVARADIEQFTYDSMQRLTRVTHADGTTTHYVYDALGNRLMKTTTLPGAPSNQPPAAVTNPSIANGLTNVPTTGTVLSWSPAVDPNSGDSVVYFIYFGTSPTPPLVFSGWPTNWSPGKLRGLTTYYWQIVARDSHNAQTASPIWSFTTGNEPPVADFAASPTNGWAPLAVTFTDRSFDTDNAIVSWQWDFDNNGTVDSTSRNPTFTYINPGDYTVMLTVRDEAGAPTTLARTNFIHVVGSGIVDLAPLGLSVVSAGSYRHLTVVYSITNRGTVSLSGVWQWADACYISTNDVWDTQDVRVGIFYESQTLPASASYARTNVVTIPDVDAQGFFLILKANGNNQIGELSEGNNTWAVPLGGILPNLVPGWFLFPSTAIAGKPVEVLGAITNDGPLALAAEWYDAIYLSTDAVFDAQDIFCGFSFICKVLSAGEGYAFTNTVSLPGQPPGNYFLVLVADGNNYIVEGDETDNAKALPITLIAPDLAPVALSAPAVAVSQQVIPVSWAVTNTGTGAAQPGWYDVVYLSTNAVWDEQDAPLGFFRGARWSRWVTVIK